MRRMVPSWRLQAACRGVDPELFFPSPRQRAAAARAICDGCPVRGECLAFALEAGIDDGVFGGLTRDERRQLKPPGRRPKREAYGPRRSLSGPPALSPATR